MSELDPSLASLHAAVVFGPVTVADFARFQEIHVRHHHSQLPES
jgi:hypothetical protein